MSINPISAIFLLTIGIVSAGFFNSDEPQGEWKCTNTYGDSMQIDIANGDFPTLNNAQLDRLYESQFEQMDITYGTPIPCYDYKKYVRITGNENSWTCTNIKTNENLVGVNENRVKERKLASTRGRINYNPRKGDGARGPRAPNACQLQRKNQH